MEGGTPSQIREKEVSLLEPQPIGNTVVLIARGSGGGRLERYTVEGFVATQAQRAAEHGDGVDRRGRQVRAFAAARGERPGGATTRQPTERPRRRPWSWSGEDII